MLIDTREPPPPADGGPARPRSWPATAVRLTWRLLAGLGLILISGAFPPVEAYAVLLAGCVLIGRGLGTIVQSTPGLKDHRQ